MLNRKLCVREGGGWGGGAQREGTSSRMLCQNPSQSSSLGSLLYCHIVISGCIFKATSEFTIII